MPYQPGQIFDRWIATEVRKREREKDFQKQLQLHFMQTQQRQVETQQTRQWTVHRDTAMNLINLYREAATPAEKETYRQQAKRFQQTMPPMFQRQLKAIFDVSPLSVQQERLDRWDKTNPPPLRPDAEMAQSDPLRYGTMVRNIEVYKKDRAAVQGVAYRPKKDFVINETFMGHIADNGDFGLIDRAAYNKRLNEIAPALDTTGAFLQTNNGWTQWKDLKLSSVDPITGQPIETLYQTRMHVDGNVEHRTVLTGAPKRGGKDKPSVAINPRAEALEFMRMIKEDTLPKDKAHPLFRTGQEVQDIQREFRKKWDAVKKDKDLSETALNLYENKLNNLLKRLDARFTYVIVPTAEDGQTVKGEDPWFGRNRLVIGKDAEIRAIMGQKDIMRSRDGGHIFIIWDRGRDMVYTSEGYPLGTSTQARQFIGNMTLRQYEGWNP